MATTLQDAERRPARARDRDRRPPGRARGARDPVSRRTRARRADGGDDRGPARRCGAADRSPGRRRSTRSRMPWPTSAPYPPPPIIIGGETARGARIAARIGDGWTRLRAPVRGAPAGLPRGARGGRPGARRPAALRQLRGHRLAERRAARRLALAARRRARRGSAGARPAPTAPSSPSERPRTWTPSSGPPSRWSTRTRHRGSGDGPWHHERVTPPAPLAATELTQGCVRCGATVPLGTAMCENCNPLGLKQPAAVARPTGRSSWGSCVAVVGLAILGRLALNGIGPFKGQIGNIVAVPPGLAVTLTVTNLGSSAGSTTCRVYDPGERRPRSRRRVHRQPADRPRSDASRSPRRSPSSGAPCVRWPSSARVRDGRAAGPTELAFAAELAARPASCSSTGSGRSARSATRAPRTS